MKEAYLPLGEIVAAHGIRGEVRVNPNTDEPELLCRKGTLYFDKAGKEPFTVLRGAPHKNIILMQIQGITTPEEAYALRGKTVYAPREDFTLEEGEYFIADIIGLRVLDANTQKEYGVLKDVQDLGAQLLYVIKDSEGKFSYLPGVKAFVKEINETDGVILVTPPEGLFDA